MFQDIKDEMFIDCNMMSMEPNTPMISMEQNEEEEKKISIYTNNFISFKPRDNQMWLHFSKMFSALWA